MSSTHDDHDHELILDAEFKEQLAVTTFSFVLLTLGIIFVISRRHIFPVVRYSRVTLYGVSLVNW
jgi:hypothetical protein